jgi:DNA-binding MarR family transcriptional regulator
MVRPFSPVESAAWGGFLSAYARLDRAIDADLLAHDGIRHVEFEVLLRLWRQPDRRLRIQELAAQSLLTRSGVSRLCNRLVRQGHIIREAAPEDRRGAYVVLTAQGARVFENAAGRHMALVREQFLGRLTEAELEQLGALWPRLG